MVSPVAPGRRRGGPKLLRTPGLGDKRGVPQPARAPAAGANIRAIKFGGGAGEGMRGPLETPLPRAGAGCWGWGGGPERVAGSCSILQQMPCNLHPNESHLPSPATCCPGLQLIYCALGCSQHKLQYSKSFCSILRGDRAQPQPLAACQTKPGAGTGCRGRGTWEGGGGPSASCRRSCEDGTSPPFPLGSSPGEFWQRCVLCIPPYPPKKSPLRDQGVAPSSARTTLSMGLSLNPVTTVSPGSRCAHGGLRPHPLPLRGATCFVPQFPHQAPHPPPASGLQRT